MGGFPWARYYDLAHGNPISDTDIEPSKRGESEGAKPPQARVAACLARTNQPPDSDAQRVTENVSRLGERSRDASGASGVPIVVHYGQVVRR